MAALALLLSGHAGATAVPMPLEKLARRDLSPKLRAKLEAIRARRESTGKPGNDGEAGIEDSVDGGIHSAVAATRGTGQLGGTAARTGITIPSGMTIRQALAIAHTHCESQSGFESVSLLAVDTTGRGVPRNRFKGDHGEITGACRHPFVPLAAGKTPVIPPPPISYFFSGGRAARWPLPIRW